MMALAEQPTVIRLAGNLSPRELETIDVADILMEADSIVFEVTRKDNWTSGDYGFTLAKHAANRYAAAMLLDQFYDPKGKSPIYMKQYEDLIAKLKTLGYGGPMDSGNPSLHIAIGSHKENIANRGPFVSDGFFGADYFDGVYQYE